MQTKLSRREMLARTGVAVSAGIAAGLLPRTLRAEDKKPSAPFRYCLNMSTLQEPWAGKRKLTVVDEVEIAAKAGFDAVELWVNEIDDYAKGGGSLKDLGKRIHDLGLTVEDGIGFAPWIVDDDAKRTQALEDSKRAMDSLAQLGCKRIAAPPAGMTDKHETDLPKLAERYRALCDLGDTLGVVPQLELWGFSKTLSRVGECAFVAIESGHPQASILLDLYHIYKGGSDFNGMKLLSANALHVIHTNDYPAAPPRDKIGDQHRVYPGDGVAPLAQIFRDLRDIGYRGVLSIELFNRTYWKTDPLENAKTALEKTKAAVAKALA